jgi:hypothetical protein
VWQPGEVIAELAATPIRPSYLGGVGDTNELEARYSLEFLGFHRCIFVRWTADGFLLRKGSGAECTVFGEKPASE